MMNLLEALEAGAVRGISELPERVIDTHISKVFLYPTKARKVYKQEKFFFGDFTDKNFRKDFYGEDFSWNRTMSPMIYIALKPVVFGENGWIPSVANAADDFYIEMNRIDDGRNLTNLMLSGGVKREQFFQIGKVMTERLIVLTKRERAHIQGVFKRGWKDLMRERLEDLRQFGYDAAPALGKPVTDRLVADFNGFFSSSSYFDSIDDTKLSVAIDNHSDNILLLDTGVGFLDVYLPKKEWSVVDAFHNICRLAADVVVLAGRGEADVLYKAYSSFVQPGPDNVRLFYEFYNAMIRGVYLYMIGKPDLAARYIGFIEENIDQMNG
jgi:aminoglycoside phosphotransferase family enzyme